jgi:hypothetical protein
MRPSFGYFPVTACCPQPPEEKAARRL